MKNLFVYTNTNKQIPTKLKKPRQATSSTPSDSQYLRTLWKLYQHARVRFPKGYFYLNTGILKEFGFKGEDYQAISGFIKLHKQLQEIYRLAEIFQFKLVEKKDKVLIKGNFSDVKELTNKNYFCYPAIFHQRRNRKIFTNKNKHYNKFRDSSTHYEYKHGIKVGGLRP